MPRKTAAQLEADIDDYLAGRAACAGLNTDGITTTPLTDAKRRSAAEFERCYLSSVLSQANGSVSEAARIAGLDRTNFRRLLHRYGIQRP